MSRTQIAAIEFLAVTCIADLPDSRAKRTAVLRAVREALPSTSPARHSATLMLECMRREDDAQKQLVLEFSHSRPEPKP